MSVFFVVDLGCFRQQWMFLDLKTFILMTTCALGLSFYGGSCWWAHCPVSLCSNRRGPHAFWEDSHTWDCGQQGWHGHCQIRPYWGRASWDAHQIHGQPHPWWVGLGTLVSTPHRTPGSRSLNFWVVYRRLVLCRVGDSSRGRFGNAVLASLWHQTAYDPSRASSFPEGMMQLSVLGHSVSPEVCDCLSLSLCWV